MQRRTEIRNHILSIAIDRYKYCSNFYNNVENSENLINVLVSRYQFEKKDIERLNNRQATKQNILFKIKKFTEILGENDSLIILFSGHGIIDFETKECYWQSVDSQPKKITTSISVAQIISLLKKSNTLHTLLIIDSCFSPKYLIEPIVEKGKNLERLKSRWVLSSGRMVLDSGDNLRMSSTFIISLTKLITHTTNKFLSISQIIETLTKATSQKIIANPLGETNHQNGEFVFRSKHFNNKISETDYHFSVENILSEEDKLWNLINQDLSIDSMQGYLDLYPNGKFQMIASNKIQILIEENEWVKIQSENSISALKKFIKKHPESNFAIEAKNQIQELSELALWEKVGTSKTNYYLKKYIKEYPSGKFIGQIDQFQEAGKHSKKNISRPNKSKRKKYNNKKPNKFILDKPLIIILILAITFLIYLWLW